MPNARFWRERWKKNEIGFHEPKPNPVLVNHFKRLALPKHARVFVPLCGKTLDIHWLLARGFRVVGAELSPIAVEQLFAELRLQPTIAKSGAAKKFSAQNIDIFLGDVLKLTRQQLGAVNAIYDRAALVALPKPIRKRYTAHLLRLTKAAPQLLVSFEYDQSIRPGPPFSITNAEILEHYAKTFDIHLLSSASVPGGLKGNCPATENLWLLKKSSRP
jgi:thiopurine S-methyltransferase